MPDGMAEEVDPQLEALLVYLRDARGFDFSGYKRGTLGRRIAKRMQTIGAESYGAYKEILEAEPQEFVGLFNTILINVTSFVRDAEAWKFVSEGIIPQLVDSLDDEQVIRVWSAGCASGEEAYSLGIVLCDAVGEDAFRSRVKVYGTDVDDDALAVARHGRYPGRDVRAALTSEQVERYFEPDGESLVFRKALRRSVIFGRHDLVQDPPISRVDLLVCRNTLMYFNAEAQQRILANFHFSLTEIGYLFVGKSEALVTRTNLFDPVDRKCHVYVKRQGARPARPRSTPPAASRAPRVEDLVDVAFERTPVAQIVVDRAGMLVLANRHARTLFALGLNQVGRPFKDLELSYQPVELRSRIDQVLRERRATTVNDVQVETPSGVSEFLDVHMQPLSVEAQTIAVAVTFLEVGRYKLLQEELERSQRELEAAYEELQSINEELETTNEELQSTNEELETTNEELHSTNEELETMNEELHSTNEELESTNNELRQRSYDLDQVNEFLESILGSLGSSVIVLNRQLAVRVWNRHSEDLWGLRADEVAGQSFLGLDIGLPVDRLSQAVHAVAGGPDGTPVDLRLPAVNRRGRAIEVDVRISGLSANGGEPDGVIVLVNRVDDAVRLAE